MLFNIFFDVVKQKVGGGATKFTENTDLFIVGKLKTSRGKLYKDLLNLNDWTSELDEKKCTTRKMREKF